MRKTISAAEARKRFAEITDEVAFGGVEYMILKSGKPVAVIMPPELKPKPNTNELHQWLDAITEEYREDFEALAQN